MCNVIYTLILKHQYCTEILSVSRFIIDVSVIYTLAFKTLILELNIKCLPVWNGCESHIYTDFKTDMATKY